MIKLLFALSLANGVETTPVVEPTQPTNQVEDFMNSYLSPDKIAMYMSWVAYAGTIIGLGANIKKLRKQKSITIQNVSEAVRKDIKKSVSEEIQMFLPSIVTTQENFKETMKDFSKILALSQENTPESRVAILEVIEHLGTIGKEITDNSKQIVQEAVKAVETKKEETNKKIDEIIENYDGTSI